MKKPTKKESNKAGKMAKELSEYLKELADKYPAATGEESALTLLSKLEDEDADNLYDLYEDFDLYLL
jgi:hypothetical protein